jgi:hypothetical protein
VITFYDFDFENSWNMRYSVTVRDRECRRVTYGFRYRLRRQGVAEAGGMNDRSRATSCSLACKVRVIRTMIGGRGSTLSALEVELGAHVRGIHSNKGKTVIYIYVYITTGHEVIMLGSPSLCLYRAKLYTKHITKFRSAT